MTRRSLIDEVRHLDIGDSLSSSARIPAEDWMNLDIPLIRDRLRNSLKSAASRVTDESGRRFSVESVAAVSHDGAAIIFSAVLTRHE